VLHILDFLSTEQIKGVATKKVQLVGASSGSRTAARGLNFTRSGGKEAKM
jgi:hypothetical protein